MTEPRIKNVVGQRIQWLYSDNPSGPAHTWLGTTDGSEITGCASVFPREMSVGGQLVKGGVLADFAVHQRHRFAGAALAIQKAVVRGARESGFDLVFGWPNDKSLPILKRIGYTVVGTSNSWAKPLRGTIALRKVLKYAWLAQLATPLANRVLWLIDYRLYARYMLAYRHEVVQRADGRFDELWERSRWPEVLGRRSSSYLNWRYAEFTTASYRFFCLMERKSNKLVGYVVFRLEQGIASIADLFCETLEAHVAPLLLSFAFFARREHARSVRVTYVGTSRFSAQLGGLGFFLRETGRRLVIDMAESRPQDLRNAVLDVRNWFMFEGELDI